MEISERFNDAELLTKSVLAIMDKKKAIEARYKEETAPLDQEIRELENAFLDKYLIDSTGKPVQKGMILEKDGKMYKVLNRSQQCFIRYLGNARVSVLPDGKKRTVDIGAGEIQDYTIVG